MTTSMDKKYTTREGRPVRLLCTDAPGVYPVVALVDGLATAQSFTAEGGFQVTQAHSLDLIEVVPYADFKIDDPVMVRDTDGEPWTPRYFSGVSHAEQATTWKEGATSWTVHEKHRVSWAECRRPTPEELAK